ncbi:MAG TPA: MFS transporter [Thermoanaerobaculia bacterium]|nr:MFS transporter [Thermoanaerobaculia bacterium]
MTDLPLLFATRAMRMFAYGAVSVVLVLYLAGIGIEAHRIGLLLTLTLIGDVIVSLYLTTRADRLGRRRTLIAGAILMAGAAAVFAVTHDFWLLLIAATIGVISPSGNEVGPFLAVEQVALADVAPNRDRTHLYAWYNLSGSFATALGALTAGAVTERLSYRAVILGYGILGIVMAVVITRLSPAVDAQQHESAGLLSIHKSRGVVAKLSGLFAIDSFAGGLVVQSILAWWFYRRFGLSPATLGAIFFGANILAGVSALAASSLARRFGLLNTMVFTHLPSNVLLLLVPFMPNLGLAITVLLLRFSISQMDVPTRQSYVMAVVDPAERTAAAGITGVARTTGAALAPILAVPLVSGTHDWIPFVAAGGLKIVYDLLLLRSFRNVSGSNPR